MVEFKNISVKNKLILIQVITAFIAVILSCVIYINIAISTLKESVERNKNMLAENIGFNAAAPLLINDQKGAMNLLLNLKNNASILNASILDKKGNEFAQYSQKGGESFVFPKTHISRPEIKKLESDNFIVHYKIYQDKEFLGTVLLHSKIIDLKTIISNYLKTAGLVLFLGVLAAYFIAIFLHRLISNPLLAMISAIQKTTETGDYSARINAEGKDEVAVLSREFNNMMAQIEMAQTSLKEMNVGLEQQINERTSDLIKTQVNLQQSEEKYRKMVEETGDAVYTTDFKGFLVYVNPICTRLTGYTKNELVGVHFSKLISPDWLEKVTMFYKIQFDDRVQETSYSFPIITKSGEKKWIEQSVTQLKEGDLITGHNAIVRDITERIKAEENLKE